MLVNELLAGFGAGEAEPALAAAPVPDNEASVLQAVDDALRCGLAEAQGIGQVCRGGIGQPGEEVQRGQATGMVGWGGQTLFGGADEVDEGEADRAGQVG